MKQYTLTKLVYANSLTEAVAKEKEGIILSGGVCEETELDEYKDIIDRKKKLNIHKDV